MSDKYSRPISTRLLLVALFALGLLYGVSQIPKSGHSHDHWHGDGHGTEMHDVAHDEHGDDERRKDRRPVRCR